MTSQGAGRREDSLPLLGFTDTDLWIAPTPGVSRSSLSGLRYVCVFAGLRDVATWACMKGWSFCSRPDICVGGRFRSCGAGSAGRQVRWCTA